MIGDPFKTFVYCSSCICTASALTFDAPDLLLNNAVVDVVVVVDRKERQKKTLEDVDENSVDKSGGR